MHFLANLGQLSCVPHNDRIFKQYFYGYYSSLSQPNKTVESEDL